MRLTQKPLVVLAACDGGAGYELSSGRSFSLVTPLRGAGAGQVLANACNACHAAGVLEAPKNGDTAAWSARADAAGGLDGLTASAIAGKNLMPARGGNPDLSDEEIRAAVELMLQEAGI